MNEQPGEHTNMRLYHIVFNKRLEKKVVYRCVNEMCKQIRKILFELKIKKWCGKWYKPGTWFRFEYKKICNHPFIELINRNNYE